MKKKIIVVIGMHRSGTSALTRALEVLNVHLGDNLMKPIADVNDKGFFEDLDINKFNDLSPDLLNLLSCMFNTNSNIRYTAKECLQHKFFTGIEYKRSFFDTSINISECEIPTYTSDDILLQRGDLKYADEIFDFYKEYFDKINTIVKD